MKAEIAEHRVYLLNSAGVVAGAINGELYDIGTTLGGDLIIGIREGDRYVATIWVETIQKGD